MSTCHTLLKLRAALARWWTAPPQPWSRGYHAEFNALLAALAAGGGSAASLQARDAAALLQLVQEEAHAWVVESGGCFTVGRRRGEKRGPERGARRGAGKGPQLLGQSALMVSMYHLHGWHRGLLSPQRGVC